MGFEINTDTYDFKNKEYFDNYKKNLYFFIYILFNIFLLIFCVFCLIFIEIPIIKNKKFPKKKTGRYTKMKAKIENNGEQFDINERFTTDPV